MIHVDFEELYDLAELMTNDLPLDDNKMELMTHISECKECYEKFCSLVAIIEATNETGLIAMREIIEKNLEPETQSIREHVFAVISVRLKMIKDQIEVVMEQLQSGAESICLEAPFAMAARDVEGDKNTKISKLEDIENEKTFITFDAVSDTIYIQVDISEFENEELRVYLVSDEGEQKEVPVSREGSLVRGKISGIEKSSFEIYIVQ